MSKISLTNLSDLNNSNSVIANINNNNSTIQTAFDNNLSRDGTAPNQMLNNLDMNNNRIINLPTPAALTEPARLLEVQTISGNAAALAIAVGQAQSSATAAAASATTASTSAAAATTSATTASTSATNAAASASAAANSLNSLLAQGIWNNTHTTVISGAYNVPSSDKTKTIQATGNNCYSIAFGSPAGYASDFVCFVQNTDNNRAKSITLSGYSSPILLWPLYGGFVFSLGGAWFHTFQPKWKPVYGAGGQSTTSIVMYVNNQTGNDALTNDGFSPSSPLFTIQEAVNRTHNLLDHGTLGVLIQLADGSHSVGAGVNLFYPWGHTELVIQGNISNPQACQIFCNAGGVCFNGQEPCTASVTGVYLNTLGSGSAGITARQFTTMDIGNVVYGPFPGGTHVGATNRSSVGIIGTQSILGGAAVHYAASQSSFISDTAFGGTIAPGLSFTVFAEAADLSELNLGGSWVGGGSGSGTVGIPALADSLSIIRTGGHILPGNGTSAATNFSIIS